MPRVDFVYALLMGLAITSGVAVMYFTRQKTSLLPWQRRVVAIGAFCGAMIGAKLPYVFNDWEGLRSGLVWFQNGKTILYGLVGGYTGVEIVKWMYDIRVKTGDSFAVPAAIAIGIGRLSCFHAGCCHGIPTSLPWGVTFPNVDQQPRHPTQIYETIFHLLAAVVLWRLLRRNAFPRQLIKLYILSYLVYRFVTEELRPEQQYWLGFTFYQWSALGLAAVFIWLWRRDAQVLSTEMPAHLGQD